MSKPTAVIHLDKRYHSGEGKYPIKVKVTFKINDGGKSRWVRKFYGKGFYCTVREFEMLSNPRSRSDKMKEIKPALDKLLARALKEIEAGGENMTVALFESRFFGIALDTLNGSFNNRIQKMEKAGRLGSALALRTALRSFQAYGLNLLKPSKDKQELPVSKKERALITQAHVIRFSEVTPDWLTDYQEWMLLKGNSINTVGIHMRSLRSVFNQAINERVVPAELYPFRTYKIRSESKFKIPISEKEIRALKDYEPEDPDQAEALDYWKLSYYCNGMNMVDVCKLQHSDIIDDFIIYDRSKTRATKINFKKIVIPLDKPIKEIIKRRGAKTLDPNGYIFPILEKDLPASTVRARVQNFIRKLNAGLKSVASHLGIKKKFTTVIARHTFANRMSNFGADRRLIQEQLGHQNASTTEHYLGSMDIEKIRKARKAL